MMLGNFDKKNSVQKSSLELLENFRDAKSSLYLEVGNMEDINNMSLKDFGTVLEFAERRANKNSSKPVPLRESNKRMIEATKQKRKNKK